MKQVKYLENRADQAIEELKQVFMRAQKTAIDHNAKLIEQELKELRQELEQERYEHCNLQIEYLDACQDYGMLQLEMIKLRQQVEKLETQKAQEQKRVDEILYRIYQDRQDDIIELDNILSQLKPLIEV